VKPGKLTADGRLGNCWQHQQQHQEAKQLPLLQQQGQGQHPEKERERQEVLMAKSLAAEVAADEQEGGMQRGSSGLLSAASGEEQVHGELLYQHSSELLECVGMERGLSLQSSYGELLDSSTSSAGNKGLLPSPSGFMQQLLSIGSKGQQDSIEEQMHSQHMLQSPFNTVDQKQQEQQHQQAQEARQQQEQQQQQAKESGGGCGGSSGGSRGASGAKWEEVQPVTFDLTATGAANPSGLPQSALLDLFADVADEEALDAR
jgi:hypothetical protein